MFLSHFNCLNMFLNVIRAFKLNFILLSYVPFFLHSLYKYNCHCYSTVIVVNIRLIYIHIVFVFTVCGEVLNGSLTTGVIESPGFSSNSNSTYNVSEECIWVLTNRRPAGSSIAIRFSTLDLEVHGECSFDFVEIREGIVTIVTFLLQLFLVLDVPELKL